MYGLKLSGNRNPVATVVVHCQWKGQTTGHPSPTAPCHNPEGGGTSHEATSHGGIPAGHTSKVTSPLRSNKTSNYRRATSRDHHSLAPDSLQALRPMPTPIPAQSLHPASMPTVLPAATPTALAARSASRGHGVLPGSRVDSQGNKLTNQDCNPI
jgi:hypothetical protein